MTGKQVIFVTNNSTESRINQSLRLNRCGIPAHPNQVVNSAYSTAVYAKELLKLSGPRNKVFVIGGAGIEAELDAVGITHLGGTDVSLQREIQEQDLEAIAKGELLDPAVGAVVIGMDANINYLKLCIAAHYLRSGAVYLATNLDTVFPAYGATFPAAAYITSALFPMVGRTPTLMGKPGPAMMEMLLADFQLDVARTCMIGDSLETDMRFAINGGLGGSILVLSGQTKRDDLTSVDSTSLPGFVLASVADLSHLEKMS